MGRSSDSRSTAPVLKLSFSRPAATNRFPPPPSYTSSPSSSSSSSSSAVTAAASAYRSTSPTRVNLRPSPPPASPSVRISLDRSPSPSRSVSLSDQTVPRRNEIKKSAPKRTCMCSPTSHPGSFRCSYHKNLLNSSNRQSISCSPSQLHLRRSAMTNSLVRIGTVEGDWVKRALSALIRPSSHQQRRRGGFQPRPSRLSVMSTAAEEEKSER